MEQGRWSHAHVCRDIPIDTQNSGGAVAVRECTPTKVMPPSNITAMVCMISAILIEGRMTAGSKENRFI